ncbi:DEAD-box ATP-dependent RNA helicase 42, partial [Ophiophagus hannah]
MHSTARLHGHPQTLSSLNHEPASCLVEEGEPHQASKPLFQARPRSPHQVSDINLLSNQRLVCRSISYKQLGWQIYYPCAGAFLPARKETISWLFACRWFMSHLRNMRSARREWGLWRGREEEEEEEGGRRRRRKKRRRRRRKRKRKRKRRRREEEEEKEEEEEEEEEEDCGVTSSLRICSSPADPNYSPTSVCKKRTKLRGHQGPFTACPYALLSHKKASLVGSPPPLTRCRAWHKSKSRQVLSDQLATFSSKAQKKQDARRRNIKAEERKEPRGGVSLWLTSCPILGENEPKKIMLLTRIAWGQRGGGARLFGFSLEKYRAASLNVAEGPKQQISRKLCVPMRATHRLLKNPAPKHEVPQGCNPERAAPGAASQTRPSCSKGWVLETGQKVSWKVKPDLEQNRARTNTGRKEKAKTRRKEGARGRAEREGEEREGGRE